MIITHIKGLITPLTTTHEPSSRLSFRGGWCLSFTVIPKKHEYQGVISNYENDETEESRKIRAT